MVFSANSQGPVRETEGRRLNLINPRGFLENLPREGVSADLSYTITSDRTTTMRSERERAWTRGQSLTSGPRRSATGEGKWADRSGLAPGGASTDRWGPGAERAYAAYFRRSEPLYLGQTIAMGCAKVLQLGDRCCIFAVAKSLETRQTRSSARAGTGLEGPANLLVGLRPREQDRRQDNGGGGCSKRVG
jgi:hypothetical protein